MNYKITNQISYHNNPICNVSICTFFQFILHPSTLLQKTQQNFVNQNNGANSEYTYQLFAT